ncbi:hypothetical protein [Moraxella marmotae]
MTTKLTKPPRQAAIITAKHQNFLRIFSQMFIFVIIANKPLHE